MKSPCAKSGWPILAQAKAVLEARAQERYEAEQAEYEAKVREREEKARQTQTQATRTSPEAADAGAAGQGSVQLHRPGLAHHEKQHERGL